MWPSRNYNYNTPNGGQSMKKVLVLAVAFLIAGCATKQYPQSAELSADEKDIFCCEDAKKEIIKQESVIAEINRTGNFDGRTVLGFLGDFGIGNGMAKSRASEKAEVRMEELKELRNQKCRDQGADK